MPKGNTGNRSYSNTQKNTKKHSENTHRITQKFTINLNSLQTEITLKHKLEQVHNNI